MYPEHPALRPAGDRGAPRAMSSWPESLRCPGFVPVALATTVARAALSSSFVCPQAGAVALHRRALRLRTTADQVPLSAAYATCTAGSNSPVAPLLARELGPVIAENGTLSLAQEGAGGVGVYAVFSDDRALQYVGISRDVATSLRKCLVRKPLESVYCVVEYVQRPSRTLLDSIRTQWLAEWEQKAGAPAPGCDGDVQQHLWENAIDVKGPHVILTDAERDAITSAEPKDLQKTLKQVCRRFQADVEQALESRGLTERLKFANKLKNQGLLDIESVQVQVPDSIGSSTRKPKIA